METGTVERRENEQYEQLYRSGYGVFITDPDDVVHYTVISQIGNHYYDAALCAYTTPGDLSEGNLTYFLGCTTCPACLEAAEGAKKHLVSGGTGVYEQWLMARTRVV
jgi:hypothetical protein